MFGPLLPTAVSRTRTGPSTSVTSAKVVSQLDHEPVGAKSIIRSSLLPLIVSRIVRADVEPLA